MTPKEARAVLAAPVRFRALGFGTACEVCSAIVVDREQHERVHAALAVLIAERAS